MPSTFLTIVALSVACLVAPSYGQSQTTTINCYQCHGYATGISQPSSDGPGCSYPFNATGLKTVQCQGQCVTTLTFSAASTSYGKYDTVIRGCTATQPTAGCYSSDTSPGTMVCIGVCSTDLCNAAVSLTQSAVVRVLAAVGFLVVVANFRRK